MVGAAGAVVGGTVAVARGGVELVPGGRQLLEHVDDATGAFADATVKTGELVAEATKQVASQADFMKIISSPEVQAKLPKIGVLRCARAKFMPAQLSVGSNSYLYTTVQAEVQGLPYSDVRAGKPLDAAQTKALKAAIDKLDALGVVAITGDCGAFVHYQVEARKMTATPMVLSPLMQAPMLAAIYCSHLTPHLTPTFPIYRRRCWRRCTLRRVSNTAGGRTTTASPTAPPATAGTWRRKRSS